MDKKKQKFFNDYLEIITFLIFLVMLVVIYVPSVIWQEEDAYKNESMSNETRFLMIEDTINYNFAGTGIAKFVAGDSWKTADKNTKKYNGLLQ